jgi:hypothetical protein
MNLLARPWLVAVCGLTAIAAETRLPSGSDQGRALAAELLSSRPPENVEIQGQIRIRDAQGRRSRMPFRYQVILEPQEWRSIYEIDGTGTVPAERLVVIHAEDRPTRYLLSRTNAPMSLPSEPALLTGDRAMIPFAQSDFWLADLGLEFLHWPTQRLIDDTKVKRRKGRVCRILESENPTPGARGYSRVVSWIDNETRKPIFAEAYDNRGRLVKEFEIGGLTKVNDRWELKDMEMRSGLTDSQTVLEFRYETRE